MSSKEATSNQQQHDVQTAPESKFIFDELKTAQFWKTCAAFLCMSLTASLMNSSAFPLFDTVFPAARDFSVVFNAVALLVMGLITAFKPRLVDAKVCFIFAYILLLMGVILMPVGFCFNSALAMTVGACAAAIARAWVVVTVGLAATRLDLKAVGFCVALATMLDYAVQFVLSFFPTDFGIWLFLLLPLVALALTNKEAQPVFTASLEAEPPVDVAVTQPSTFISLSSQLFVSFLLFRVAFGYSLRFGETNGVPVSDIVVIIPVALMALYFLRTQRRLIYNLLVKLSVILVVAGFWAVSAGRAIPAQATVSLLSAGNVFFDIMAWSVLITIGARNPRGAVAMLAWGRGVGSVGSIIGAALGVWTNSVAATQPVAVVAVSGVLVIMFVAYALFGLSNFDFVALAQGVVAPAETAPVQVAESTGSLEQRCKVIGQRAQLTPREQEVFAMLARGRDRAYIEEALVVSRNTVKAHVKHIYTKLDIHSHQELINIVEQEGLS